MTGKGALAAMVTGFLAVPIFKFGVANLPEIGPIFKALEELPPSFALSAIVGILVSLWDKEGQKKMQGIAEELKG